MKILIAIAAAVVIVGVVLAASAKFDTPSQTATVERVIDASREDVWAELADLESYAEWNPFVTQASGELQVGRELRLVLVRPGEDREETTVKVLTATFERKLRVEDRLVLPGVRDEEMTIRVVKLTPTSIRFEGTIRMEGLLAPFADLEPTRNGLELMASALAQRVEAQR